MCMLSVYLEERSRSASFLSGLIMQILVCWKIMDNLRQSISMNDSELLEPYLLTLKSYL